MTEPHLSEEVLISLADEWRPDAEIDPHLLSCPVCSELLSFYRTLNSEMKQQESWRIEEEYRTRRGGRSLADLAARIEAEDADAPALLGDILERLARDPNADIAADPRFRTGGVLRALEQFVLEQRVIDAFVAERFARLSCILAEAISDDYYPAHAMYHLRGRAWVLHANALLNLDRYDEAFQDADRAERAYEHLADSGIGLAAVAHTRAIVHFKLKRFSEALSLIKSAAAQYERRGDRRKCTEMVEMTAAILHEAGEYGPALEMYLDNLQAADELHDAEMRARLMHAAGMICRQIGDLENSGKYLLEALHIYEGLGMKLGVSLCRWSVALLALAQAEFLDAEKLLRATVDALTEMGSEQWAADAKLDLAEALLMLGRPQEIETLCREAEATYARLRLMSGRLAAARYLRNAAANQMLRREDIQHVRAYIEESREAPDTPFAPPRKNGPPSGH
jgi:tetratricopeptide (TPR) repeat protein